MKRWILLIALVASAQMALAREIYPLNDGWQFFFRTENDSEHARIVSLPHSWNNNPLAGYRFDEATGHYLQELYIPNEWSGKRLFLKFYGAQSVANLFINGYHVGEHRGGGTAFCFEITDRIRVGTTNAVQVIVSNNFRSDVLPVSTDINLYGGLHRGVELIVTDQTAISPLYWGSDGVLIHTTEANERHVKGEVEVHLLTTAATEATLRIELLNDRKKVVLTRTQRIRGEQKEPILLPFGFERPKLWSPEEPNLYTLRTTIESESGRDQVEIRTGFRQVEIDPQTGWIAINGTPQQLKGVVVHHDNATSGLPTQEDYDTDLRLIEELGANAIRSAVMPHGDYFYQVCDQRGLLVWIDSPLQRAPFMADQAYFSTPLFEQNALDQLREIIAQHINHPSVILWGIFSRLSPRGQGLHELLRRMNEEAHRLDPNRLTVACSDQDGPINFLTDLIVWHQELGWQRGLTEDLSVWRDQLRTSWGHLHSAISYGGEGFLGMTRLGVQRTKGQEWASERRQALFHEDYCRELQADSLFWGTWIENMFEYGSARRAYSINGQGLVTLNRREKKDAYYLYRALWNKQQPTLHLADRRYRMRSDTLQHFTVYSSEPNPLLLVQDDTIRLHPYAPCQYRSDTISIHGTAQVRLSAGGLGDGAIIQIGSLLRPAGRLGLPQTTNQ